MPIYSSHIAALRANVAKNHGKINFKRHLSDEDIDSLRKKYVVPNPQNRMNYFQAQPNVQQVPQAQQIPQQVQAVPVQNYSYPSVQYPNYQLVQSYPLQAQYPQVQSQQAQAVNYASAPMNAANAYNAQVQQPAYQTQGQNLNVTTGSVQSI